MTPCAICYVGDINFLLPALVAASSVRKFVAPEKATIYIILIGDDENRLEDLNAFLQPQGIRVLPMKEDILTGFVGDEWHTTHVPVSTLGRFFITDLLPDSHKRILYLDGDMWIADDPLPLIDYDIPEGRFAAVEDKQWFCRNDIRGGREIREYFEGIGLDGENGYFNGGMFLVGTETWRKIAREAYNFFKDNTRACKYHDQSALNAVVGDRRLRLSLAWNFQTPYRSWGFEKIIVPRIYHFIGPRKPWMGPLYPWEELFPLYEKEMARFAPFHLPRHMLSPQDVVLANKRSLRGDAKLKYIYPFRSFMRRSEAAQLQMTTILNIDEK